MATDLSQALHHQRIVGGDTWSCVVKRGQGLALVDSSGNGNCTMLAYHARNTTERYNMPDSLKGQHTAKYTTGHCLYSDMGRVLLAVVDDERGWHDPLGAYSTAAQAAAQYGDRRYQQHRNQRCRNTLDNLIVELGKHGLDSRDWQSPVNWFSTVVVDERGMLTFDSSRNAPGQRVVLRAGLDVLVCLSATPHPLDGSETWNPQPIDAYLLPADATDDTPCRSHCDENGRAFALTEQAALAY